MAKKKKAPAATTSAPEAAAREEKKPATVPAQNKMIDVARDGAVGVQVTFTFNPYFLI